MKPSDWIKERAKALSSSETPNDGYVLMAVLQYLDLKAPFRETYSESCEAMDKHNESTKNNI